jgi:hypothetical protein
MPFGYFMPFGYVDGDTLAPVAQAQALALVAHAHVSRYAMICRGFTDRFFVPKDRGSSLYGQSFTCSQHIGFGQGFSPRAADPIGNIFRDFRVGASGPIWLGELVGVLTAAIDSTTGGSNCLRENGRGLLESPVQKGV